MTDTAINSGLRIALDQVNAALRRHGIEPSGDYGADIERIASDHTRLQAEVEALRPNADRYLWLRDKASEKQQDIWLAYLPDAQDAYVDRCIDSARAKKEEA